MSRTPARFRAETKYVQSQGKKANVNLPSMAVVGDGGGTAGVAARANFYWIRLINDDNRLTQCRSLITLSDGDVIYVRRAADRNLSFYEFDKFIENSAGGLVPPIQPHDHTTAAYGDTAKGEVLDWIGW